MLKKALNIFGLLLEIYYIEIYASIFIVYLTAEWYITIFLDQSGLSLYITPRLGG
jgi:hypothetical protein